MQSVIRTFDKDSKAWFGRDRNTVAGVLESLQTKAAKGSKLFELFFSNLMVSRLWVLSSTVVVSSSCFLGVFIVRVVHPAHFWLFSQQSSCLHFLLGI